MRVYNKLSVQASWHFGPPDSMTANDFDFQLNAARLITQGLGFYSNLFLVNMSKNPNQPKMFALPKSYKYKVRSEIYFDLGEMTYLDSIKYCRAPEGLTRTILREFDPNSPMQPLSTTWDRYHQLGLYKIRTRPNILRKLLMRLNLLWGCQFNLVGLQVASITEREIEARFTDGEPYRSSF